MIEKIISRNVGVDSVKPGQIQTVNVDRVMIHDIFIPFVAEKFEEMGFTKLWDPDKVVLIYDHMVPASTTDDIRHFKIGDAFAKKYGMKNVHRSDGICHQLMTECGYAKPGNIVFGTDSHTTTYGCVGCFSSGIGYTEMAAILGTGEMWVRVPETISAERFRGVALYCKAESTGTLEIIDRPGGVIEAGLRMVQQSYLCSGRTFCASAGE